MKNNFFAMLSRQKFIRRWGLMRNLRDETLTEHAYETAALAHALAVIGKKELGRELDPNAVCVAALYHDASEVYTGDLPTPIKYYGEAIRRSYHDIEDAAVNRLLSGLPEELRGEFAPILSPEDETVRILVKAADKLSAYIKCIEEVRGGNHEFESARLSTLESMKKMNCPELDIFIERFLPAYSLDLDQMQSE